MKHETVSKIKRGERPRTDGYFFTFLAVRGLGCPDDQVKGRDELGRVLLRGEPSMLAQSNKLVGITRAMESRWWRRRRSPPARPRHQLAELNPAPGLSSPHTYICTYNTCTYIFHAGSVYRFRGCPSRGSMILSSIAATLGRRLVICDVSREFIGLADKRKTTLLI